MANKLWDKGFKEDERIDAFTVGNDRELDHELAPYDIMGTMAHITMLESVGLLSKEDLDKLLPVLKELYSSACKGELYVEEDVEDIHSQIELMLTRRLGDVGKKVHTGRSRNDQVLVDLKLYARAEIENTVHKVESLFNTLQEASERYKDVLIPGYTHLQVAMPSSFGLWFGAYAESLCDDLSIMKAAWDVVNLNPLGSAAGYGSSAPLNRTLTTVLLGFEDLDYNSVYAQMTRGKMERAVAFAYSSVAETVGRLAMDGCLFSSQNFGFIHLPDALTTGSSIMPHKKNPDVFELIRAKCNKLQSLPQQIMMIMNNLPVGYFRDLAAAWSSSGPGGMKSHSPLPNPMGCDWSCDRRLADTACRRPATRRRLQTTDRSSTAWLSADGYSPASARGDTGCSSVSARRRGCG